MTADDPLAPFRFDDEATLLAADDYAHVARIPAGLRRKRELMAALAASLALPRYFGSNWDALSDCLRDLSWLPAGKVLLLHGDVPPKRGAHRETYLDILREAQQSWAEDDVGRLVAAFPAAARSEVERRLGDVAADDADE